MFRPIFVGGKGLPFGRATELPPSSSKRSPMVKFLVGFPHFRRRVDYVEDLLTYKVGPLLVINGVITPISRVKSPQLPIYFRPFIGLKITPFITGRGAHLVGSMGLVYLHIWLMFMVNWKVNLPVPWIPTFQITKNFR